LARYGSTNGLIRAAGWILPHTVQLGAISSPSTNKMANMRPILEGKSPFLGHFGPIFQIGAGGGLPIKY